MIWILSAISANTRTISKPNVDESIEALHSVVYKPGTATVPRDGTNGENEPDGTFERGPTQVSGFVFTFDGSAVERLFQQSEPVDLVVMYLSAAGRRIRTFRGCLFSGNTTVAFTNHPEGAGAPVGIPFRLQIPVGETLSDAVVDEAEE